MIRIEHLTKRFGKTAAVNDVTLSIAQGESVALWGGNGAGKSTIIRCVLGLIRFEGNISVRGFDVTRQGKRARSLIGYVPQELGFYDDLRVGAAIEFFARLKNVADTDVSTVLANVALNGHECKRVRELSGGMKQRLALAIALLGDPPILVLDEVTASLDTCGREEFVAFLSRLSHSGRAMLFASHRLEEVKTLATRMVCLNKGRISAEMPVSTQEDVTLHLHIAAGVRDQALHLLRSNGFDSRLNGIGLLVRVPALRKAAPFEILSGRVAVTNFEVLDPARVHFDMEAHT